MTLPVTSQPPSLPGYLSNLADFTRQLNDSVVGGIKTGGHPSIGIRASKWRIREGAEDEMVPSLTLDVIVVGANPHLSKIFYDGAYNPKEEGRAPDCFSDNGIGPSSRCAKPQADTCAACPRNVFGSRIGAGGAKAKACGDFKKLAVILADDPERNVYELRLPWASLKGLNVLMGKLRSTNVPVSAVVVKLSFDAEAEFPLIQFAPTRYITQGESEIVARVASSHEVAEAVSLDDKVAGETQATPAPAPIAKAPEAKKPEPDPMAFLNSPPEGGAQEPPKRRGRPPKSETAAPTPAPAPSTTAADRTAPLDLPPVPDALDDLLKDILPGGS